MKINELIKNNTQEIYNNLNCKQLYDKVINDINNIILNEHIVTKITCINLYAHVFKKIHLKLHIQVDTFTSKSDHFDNTLEGFNIFIKEPLSYYNYNSDIFSFNGKKLILDFSFDECNTEEEIIPLKEIYG